MVHHTEQSHQTEKNIQELTTLNHAITTNTTHSSEQISKDASHTATYTAGRHLDTPCMRRTRWRRVRLLMVSQLSKASIDPGNINEHASNDSSASTTVTSTLHAARPKQATIARGSQPHRQLSYRRTDIQNKGLDGDRGSVRCGHVHDNARDRRRRVNIVAQKQRRAGKGLTST